MNNVIHTICALLLIQIMVSGQGKFTLPLAIEFAVEHSNDMKREILNIQDAEQTVQEFKSVGLPKLDFGANYAYYFIRPSQPTEDFLTPAVFGILNEFVLDDAIDPGEPQTFNLTFARRNNLSGFLDFRALVFDGVFFEGLKAAKASVDLQKERSKLASRDIAIEVTRAYLGTLVARANQAIIDSNLITVEALLYGTKETYKAGFAEKLDVDRLQLSYDNLITEKENLSNLIELSKNLLKFHMNYPLDDDIILLDDLESLLQLISVKSEVDITSLDFNNRPEVAVLEKAMELDQYDINRLGLRLPVIKANANIQETLSRDKFFSKTEPGFIPGGYVGLSLEYAILDGKSRKSQQQRARIRQEKKRLDLEDFKRGMQLEVLNTQTQLGRARKTLSDRKKALELSEEIYRKTNIKFSEGVGSSLEVSQAEISLYEAQSDYISAMYAVVDANTEFDIAIGNIK